MQINFHISNTYTAEELDIAIRDGKKVYWSPDHNLLDLQAKPKQEVYEILEGDPVHRVISDSVTAGATLYKFYIED